MISVFNFLIQKKLKNNAISLLLGLAGAISPILAFATTFDASPQVIDSNLAQALAVATADIDNDGDQDVVAVGASSNSLIWYENPGDASSWSEHLIDGAVKSPSRVVVINMDSDDELEIVVSAIGVKGTADDNIYLYDPPAASPATVPWSRSVITDFAGAATQPNGIEVVDIDGDTDLDVVAALFDSDKITWYENPGIATMTSTQWAEHTIESSVLNPRFVIAANIDGDNYIDIVTASFSSVLATGRITWHESTDKGASWSQHIDLSTKRAVSLAAGDINDDDKIDIIAALRFDNSVAVLEQPASTPASSSWSEVTVSSTVPQTRSVAVADIDNDCDLDIATAAFGTDSSGTGGKVLWHDNPQIGANASWDTYVIDETNINGATEVVLADLDGDGLNGSCLGTGSRDLDVINTIYIGSGAVNWYSNQRKSTIKITDLSNQILNIPLSLNESNQPAGSSQKQFRVELQLQPATGSTVTVPIVLPTIPASEVTSDKSSLVFNDTNWNSPQTVTLTAVNDAIDDGDQNFNIAFGVISSPLDAQYDGVVPDSLVAVTTHDDDTAGVTVNPLNGQTSETGGTAAFTAVLDSEPLEDVTITVASSNTGEGTVNKSSLTFTSANWDQAQTVTVTGVNDAIDDGNIAYSIALGLSSADSKYAAINPADISMVNNDDDSVGISAGPASGATSENGTKATFTVALTSEPLADIVIDILSQDSSEGIAAPGSLTFTSVNWSDAQTVTVTGQDDNALDGTISYNVRLSVSNANGDIKYATISPVNVPLSNQDNEQLPSDTIFDSGGFEGD